MSQRKIDEACRKATPSGMSVVKRVRTEAAPVENIVSETDERIRQLYERQTATDISLDGVRERFKDFSRPSLYKSSLNDVRGQRSLEDYSSLESAQRNEQELRDCGLNDDEISFWKASQKSSHDKRPDKFNANPEMVEQRFKDLAQRIASHREMVMKKRDFSSAQSTSRLKLELEAALNQGRKEQQKLSSLVLKSQTSSSTDTPEAELKQIAEDLSERRPAIPDYGNPFPNPWTPVVPKLPASEEFIGPKERDADLDVSDNMIYSNKMSIEDLKLLSKFSNYTPGPPSKTLYVKNLGSTVRHAHLIHLFGRFRVPGDEPITCKLMTGRMRGQAFVTCADVETASRCLHTLCGYKLRGRPMIISFRQTKPDGPQASSE